MEYFHHSLINLTSPRLISSQLISFRLNSVRFWFVAATANWVASQRTIPCSP